MAVKPDLVFETALLKLCSASVLNCYFICFLSAKALVRISKRELETERPPISVLNPFYREGPEQTQRMIQPMTIPGTRPEE